MRWYFEIFAIYGTDVNFYVLSLDNKRIRRGGFNENPEFPRHIHSSALFSESQTDSVISLGPVWNMIHIHYFPLSLGRRTDLN